MAPVNFYRECDLVAEAIIPPETASIISSDAYEASAKNVVDVFGENRLVDGISVRTPGWLLSFFKNSRDATFGTVEAGLNKVDAVSRGYYARERKITSTIANLHSDPKEELFPGFCSILVAGLAGSILGRRRGWGLRVAAPLVLAIGAFSYTLPTTFQNSKNLCYDLEKSRFPRFVEKQGTVVDSTKKAVCFTVDASVKTYQSAQRIYGKVTKVIRDWTGLNI
ncbi:Mic26p Ecym_2065 [Eremothecium cymbalariae DBVPG|uniref:MICOS complex subunit n=1 Tax=Eremothecium cymbalariae (strain CBS 270.75 / DBVPG 7215 / KCTC 17166 / NRRL Y-17582) TaxID=931890 RepID=G8JP22_ERECY|nr:Hypothetical protein Ecym_2065 [Eremothecium cymbalariae DBVPG\